MFSPATFIWKPPTVPLWWEKGEDTKLTEVQLLREQSTLPILIKQTNAFVTPTENNTLTEKWAHAQQINISRQKPQIFSR